MNSYYNIFNMLFSHDFDEDFSDERLTLIENWYNKNYLMINFVTDIHTNKIHFEGTEQEKRLLLFHIFCLCYSTLLIICSPKK